MEHFRAFAERRAAGHIDVGQQRGVEPFVFPVTALFHEIAREIHVHQAVVCLDDTVLQARWHIQFPGFGFEHQVGLYRERDLRRDSTGTMRAGTR